MSEAITVTGIILSSMPVGEADRRIVLLTKELGKISAFAKGARRQSSALIGLTRPFIFGEFQVYVGRNSYTIYKAQAKEYFENLVTDLDAICYGYYFAEIADYYSRENLDATELINLLYISLKALLKDQIPNSLIRCIYELRMIAINGECPDFFTCLKCKREDNIYLYSARTNGVYCKDCAKDIYDGIVLSKDVLYTLQYIVTMPLTKLYNFVLNDETLTILKKVVNCLENTCFDKKFKSKDMILE